MSVYLRPDGKHTPYPISRDTAKEKKALRYDTCEQCLECADVENGCSLKYTSSDNCVLCSRLDALDFFNNNYEDPKTPVDAMARDLDFFVIERPCDKAGHLGIQTLDHRCAVCVKDRHDKKNLARVAAREAREMFYTPTGACEDCHTISPRRVNNNSCRQCEINQGYRGMGSILIVHESPDMIMDKSLARTLGFKVYRTGKECHRGHTAWRYVSTGGCLECKS